MEQFYIKNNNPDFWKKERTNCNCGGFALNTQSWVCPYDHDEEYTDDSRTQIIRDMYEEGFSKEAIMEAIMILDQESLLRSCSWIEPVLPEEILPNDRVVAYRLFLDETAKFSKVVEQILILVAVAGENIENQRFSIWHKKRVFVGEPFHIIKIW